MLIMILCLFSIKSNNTKYSIFPNDKGDKYKKEWAKVDSLEKKGLPKSALKIVHEILKKAKNDNNGDQIIKALTYRMKFTNMYEEDAFENMIFEFKKEAEESKFPNNAILNSMLAELYWLYYQKKNRYRFMFRTKTINFTLSDIKTWTLNQLIDQSIKHYNKSLEQKTELQKTPMKTYDEIISWGSKAKELRPTLYDFLAHRAIDFFSNTSISLTKPADQFTIKQAFYFDKAENFVVHDISSSDSLSLHYQAIIIIKELLIFRLKDKNDDALIDVDIKRLTFAKRHSVHENKSKLYLEALKRMEIRFKAHSYSSEISYLIANYYYMNSSKYKASDELSKIYKTYKKTALDICNKVINTFPKTNAASRCKTLKYKILSTSLSFHINRNNPANQKFSSKITYKNLEKIYIRVASIDRNKLISLRKKHYGKKLFDKILANSKKIYTENKELPVDKDYNSHSVELLLNKLALGKYVIMISNNEKFAYEKNMVSYAFINITNLSYIRQKLSDGSYNFYILNRTTGQPIKGVSVKTKYSNYNYKLRRYINKNGPSFISDANGFFHLKSNHKSSRSYQIELTKGTDFYESSGKTYVYNYNYKPTNKIRTTLFTDRAIYRPGQTVYFKGIVIKTNGETSNIKSEYTSNIILYDVNHQKVSDLKVTTNKYGTYSGSFEIPRGLLNGRMQLYTNSGSKYFQVEEYKRPKFEVSILPFKGNYLLNDSVKVKGNAISFAGSKLTDAKVKYRVVRKPVWTGWWHYNYGTSSTQVTDGYTNTDDNGEFKITFKAIPDLSKTKSEWLAFSYSIYVDITDINGETHSASKSITVGYKALKISLDLTDKINKADSPFSKENKGITINTKNLNSEFVTAKGDIKIFKLKDLDKALKNKDWQMPDKYLYSKDEWNKEFSGNVYKDENNLRKREKDNQVFSGNFNTAENKKLIIDDISKWKTGNYIVEINSKDFFGNKINYKKFFTVYDEKSKKMPTPIIDWFATINNSGEPGDKVKFLIGSGLSNVKLLYEIEHKGSSIKKEWITINNEQKLIEIPIEEKHRGNFSVYFIFIKNNKTYSFSELVHVPYTNKKLDITFETFRDKLYPGQKEEWKLKIKGHKGEKIAAEMLATLYDASLDQFRKDYWGFNIYKTYYAKLKWGSPTFGNTSSSLLKYKFDKFHNSYSKYYDKLNWFGLRYGFHGLNFSKGEKKGFAITTNGTKKRNGIFKRRTRKSKKVSAEKKLNYSVNKDEEGELNDEVVVSDKTVGGAKPKDNKTGKGKTEKVQVRTNFNETAFFYPHLETNSEGEIIIKFTVPESLTKWNMKGFAHTSDLKFGLTSNSLVTQKDLMVMPNNPRFFREFDKIEFPAKISNISSKNLSGTVSLELIDAITMKPIKNIFAKGERTNKNFSVKSKKNTVVKWNLEIPSGYGAIAYRIIAKADKFSDGEQKALPVLTNRMLVTESLPLPIRSKQTKKYKFTKLVNSGKSKSLKHFKLTLEFTSNPAWYAIQALPYLMEYPYECTEQTFSRYYANSIASHISNSTPKIKRVFDSWKNDPNSKELLSNLEKNQELKAVLLEETPWVLNSQNETERKKRVGLLFDLNRMGNELSRAMRKLQKSQSYNGGWSWFKGMPESRYITQHIVTGMGHLDKLKVRSVREDSKTWQMLKKAVSYLDIRIKEDYDWQKKHYSKKELLENHLSYTAIQYLYGRSYFTDLPIPKRSKEAFEYYKGQSGKYWLSQNKYMQGMIALSLHRYKTEKIPMDIIKSLKEHSTESEEMGLYWKDNLGGYYWHQAPIETQALMIEAFDEVAKDKKSVESLKVWLLKQKQTQDWRTTKATVEAVYALLLRGMDMLASDKLVKIKLGNLNIDPKKMDNVKVEAGTGYFKTSWGAGEIKPEMGNVTVTKEDEGVAWGALYWQYFEDLDKITPHKTPLHLEKKLFIERITKSGKVIEPISKKAKLKVGDKIIVRIVLRVDRRMEYVHMKDMRASGFEPINVISRYKYQDGLGYYESTKDAATNFFMSALPKGTFVFEYPLRVTHNGNFSNGITTIQCMYAPEFTSHSEGIRVDVVK